MVDGRQPGTHGSPILVPIYTAAFSKSDEEYVSARGLSSVDDLDLVTTGRFFNHVVTNIEKSTATSIDWASRQGLQCETPKMEAVLFTRTLGYKTQLWPKLTKKL